MKNRITGALVAALLLAAVAPLASFTLGGKEMALAGTGERVKFFVTIYYASLYVPAGLKGKGGETIAAADEPMSVVLKVDSTKLTRERFMSATRDGFANVAGLGYPTSNSERFLSFFGGIEIAVGDCIYLSYVPGQGLTAAYQSVATGKIRSLGSIAGLAFKKALFAIWLGPDPVQGGLKDGMLGR